MADAEKTKNNTIKARSAGEHSTSDKKRDNTPTRTVDRQRSRKLMRAWIKDNKASAGDSTASTSSGEGGNHMPTKEQQKTRTAPSKKRTERDDKGKKQHTTKMNAPSPIPFSLWFALFSAALLCWLICAFALMCSTLFRSDVLHFPSVCLSHSFCFVLVALVA